MDKLYISNKLISIKHYLIRKNKKQYDQYLDSSEQFNSTWLQKRSTKQNILGHPAIREMGATNERNREIKQFGTSIPSE